MTMTSLPSGEDLAQQAGSVLTRNLKELDAYHYSPLPSPRDEEITALIDAYRALGAPGEREAFARRLTGWQRGTLSSYFDRAAMLAVRARSVDGLIRAAVALTISQYGADPRELQMTLPILCRAIELLGAGVEPYLQAAADAPSPALADALRNEAAATSTGCVGLPSTLREVEGPNGVVWINAARAIPPGW